MSAKFSKMESQGMKGNSFTEEADKTKLPTEELAN